MISFGVDILLSQDPSWKNDRIGLVTNHAATTNSLVSSRQALVKKGYNIRKLFSPEHGLLVKGADGHLMRDGIDEQTGLPVISLYSEKLAPAEEDMSDIDIVLFDIPDIGARFYTYLWTMSYLLEACAQYHKPLVILDRPNPISGKMELAEGPLLDTSLSSFIGRWPIPVRHSCTMGELAQYFNRSQQVNADLAVIKAGGWRRDMFQPDWGIDFIPTSPAIRNFQGMLLYPGLCLLEATNICEGRSTAHSFTSVTAPWIDSEKLCRLANDIFFDDLQVQPVSYIPVQGKYAGEKCNGIQLSVPEPSYFQPVFTGMVLLKLIRDSYPAHFRWHTYPTLVNPSGEGHLDKLLGRANSGELFGTGFRSFIATTKKMTVTGNWAADIASCLLYP